ncbi:TRAP transporter large permease subunit, partial [Morganella morganii]
TGQFTIPLMKRFGYKPAFAGGVEATASMGSQLMPPVMGAVAFIMAETINV